MTIKTVTLKMAVTRIKRISNIPDKINLLQNKAAFQKFSSHEEAAKSVVLIREMEE
jgi:hypothetical protein